MPVDWQLTDTYFVVAHLHYVLLGINVFPVIGGIYYWFPKFTGRMLDERLGSWNFWIMFVGFNVGFFPDAHRRACSGCRGASIPIPPDMGWDTVNLITSVGIVRVRARRRVVFDRCPPCTSQRCPRHSQPVGCTFIGMVCALPAAPI